MHKSKKAYSLIELSISILIIAVIIAGSVGVAEKISNKRRIDITQIRIQQAVKAIQAYLLANGSLPCPASLTISKSSDSNSSYGVSNCSVSSTGVYESNTTSNILVGMLPVVTLGLERDIGEDFFGNKMIYVVDKNLTSKATFGLESNQTKISVKESVQSGEPSQLISSEVVLAIISYGANGRGAFPSNVSNFSGKNISSTSSSELENEIKSVISGTKVDFDNNIIASDSSDSMFDDIVFYRSKSVLISEFDALSQVKCPATSTSGDDLTITYGATTTTFSWPEAKYGEVVQSSVQCPVDQRGGVNYPTRRCGAYGVWEFNSNSGVISPCKPNPASASSDYCAVNIAGLNVLSVPPGSTTVSCTLSDLVGSVTLNCNQGVLTTSGSCRAKKRVCLVLPGTNTWTVPTDWISSNNTIEVIGGGGGSGRRSSLGSGFGGGGGGYSRIDNLSLTSGSVVSYAVGQGGIGRTTGDGDNGGDTWFNGSSYITSSVGAKGGTRGGIGPATGGSASNGIGTIKFSGGNGGSGGGTSSNAAGSGGGGAAGPNGNGANGGVFGTVFGGGGGAAGGGSAGGSGGTSSSGSGGNGANSSGLVLGTGGASVTSGGSSGNNGTSSNQSSGGGGSGGGGSGSASGSGGNGGNGSEWNTLCSSAVGSGGGGGGGGDIPGFISTTVRGGNGGLYGGGGGSAPADSTSASGGNGANGIIVITY